MPRTITDPPKDPVELTATLRERSREAPVLVVKLSPICPVSHFAESNYRDWLSGLAPETPLQTLEIDVIAEKPTARGLTAELGIRHESPQALLFRDGELVWHDSHDGVNADNLSEALG